MSAGMYDRLESVEHTVDQQGFVLVGGERVINTIDHGRPVLLKSSKSYRACCQLCTKMDVEVPLRLVSEFEHAIGAARYFHVGVTGAFNDYRLCAACASQ